MKTLIVTLFLIASVAAPNAFSSEGTHTAGPKEDITTDKKPPHGDDGTGGNGGNGGIIILK